MCNPPPNSIPQDKCEHRLRCITGEVECICKTHWRLRCPNCGSIETFKSKRSVPKKRVSPIGPMGTTCSTDQGLTPFGPTFDTGSLMFSIGGYPELILYCAKCGTMYVECIPKEQENVDDVR